MGLKGVGWAKGKSRGKGKDKFRPRTGHEGPEGEQSYCSTLSLTSALDWVGGQRLGRFTLGKDPLSIVLEAGWAPGANVDVYCERRDETSGSITEEYLI